jgi:hypothetical protein
METLRPKLIGSGAVARELDAPLLGTLSTEPGEASEAELGPLALRVRLAGKAAGLPNLRLVPVRAGTDLAGFARWLNDRRVAGDEEDSEPSRKREYVWVGSEGASSRPVVTDEPYRIRPFDAESVLMNGGGHMGLVLVSPDHLAKSELEEVRDLLRFTPGELVGVVTYREPRGAGLRDRLPVGRSSES